MPNEKQNTVYRQADVIRNAFPCPFCGEKPHVEMYPALCIIDILCVNHACFARPAISEEIEYIENKGGTITYTTIEKHWQKALDKWNKRHSI